MSRRKPALAAGALAISMLAAAVSHGADFTVTPRISSRFEADTNWRLLFDDPKDVVAAIVDASLDLQTETAAHALEISPRVRALQFTNNQNPDREEYGLDVAGQKFWDRWTLFSAGTIERRSAIDTELTQTGLTFSNLNRDAIAINSGVTYEFSPTLAFTASGSWQDVTFEKGVENVLVDFRFWSSSLSGEYHISPSTFLTARFDFSNFEAPETDSSTDTFTIWVGGGFDLGERIDVRARGGMTISELEFQRLDVIQVPGLGPLLREVPDSSTEIDYVIDASLTKEFVASTLEIQYARTLSPSSRGAQSISNQYTVTGTHFLGERTSSQLELDFLERAAEGEADVGLDLEVARVDLRLTWRATPALKLRGGYRFRWRSFRARTATSHGLHFALDYQFDPIRFP